MPVSGKCPTDRSAHAVSLNYNTGGFISILSPFLAQDCSDALASSERRKEGARASSLRLIPWKTASPLSVCTPSGYVLSGSRRVFVKILRLAVEVMHALHFTEQSVNVKPLL